MTDGGNKSSGNGGNGGHNGGEAREPDPYDLAGYNFGRIGLGEKPAVLIVDFQLGFTSTDYVFGRSDLMQRGVENTAELLKVARRCNVPVASCYTAYHSPRDMPHWKVEDVHDHFYYGHPSTAIDPRVLDDDYDFVFCKPAPSIFFNTPLTTFLAKNRVDTTVMVGCTTSGCVRASVIDSFSHGYRTQVVEPCCGDVDIGPHRDNLRDVGRRYADVVGLDEITDYFEEYRKKNAG